MIKSLTIKSKKQKEDNLKIIPKNGTGWPDKLKVFRITVQDCNINIRTTEYGAIINTCDTVSAQQFVVYRDATGAKCNNTCNSTEYCYGQKSQETPNAPINYCIQKNRTNNC